MRKYFLLFSIFLLSFKGYTQILFEEGYYVDNDGRRVDCLIKFLDWKNNPAGFDYKLTPEWEVRRAAIGDAKEFQVRDAVRYVRATVDLDRSTEEIVKLTTERNPVFAKEELFLNVLVEGEVSLYSYIEGNLTRFFVKKGNGPIEALVYKLYKTGDGRVAKNNLYQKQLLDSLGCALVTENDVKMLRYRSDDLVRILERYGRCSGTDVIVFGEKKKGRDLFNLSVRPRLNRSSLSVSNSIEFFGFDAVDYGSQFTVGLGVDAEFILPFFRNKWAIAIEPAYQGRFKGEREMKFDFLRERDLRMSVSYKAWEIPVGVRYYMFLNEKSKISANAYYVYHFGSKSRIDFSGSGSSFFSNMAIEPDPKSTFILGLAYKFNNRFGLEARYYFRRDITGNYVYWYSDYNSISLALGLSLF